MYYIVQCIVINHFQKNSLAQMEEFDHKFKWTKTSQEVFQNFVNKRKSFPEKCLHKRQTFPREKLPYFFLPNPLEGSIHPGWVPRFKDLLGKLQWHLGGLTLYFDIRMQFSTRWYLEFLGKQTGDWLWGEQKQLTHLVSIAGGRTGWIMMHKGI